MSFWKNLYNLSSNINNNVNQLLENDKDILKVSNETLKIVQQIKPNDSSNANDSSNESILADLNNIKAILANHNHLSNTAMFENSMFDTTVNISEEDKIAFTKTSVFAKMQQYYYDLLNYYYNQYITKGGNTNDLEMLNRRLSMVTANHNYNAMNQCLKTKYIDDLTKNTADSIVNEVTNIL